MKLARTTLLICLGLLPAYALFCLLLWERPGMVGGPFGMLLALFSILSFGMLARAIGQPGGPTKAAVFFTCLVWVVKLPLLWIVVSHVVGLGQAAVGCFLGGLGLVYSVLVSTAVVADRQG